LYEIYERFGIYQEMQLSLWFPEEGGQMEKFMEKARTSFPKKLCGIAITAWLDYKEEIAGFPISDVLSIRLEDQTKIVIRPSGTEPKIKIYIMALPQKFKYNQKLHKSKEGVAEQQALLSSFFDKQTNFPKGVVISDIDDALFNFVETNFKDIIPGKELPILKMTPARWAEFSKTVDFYEESQDDEYETLTFPMLLVVKQLTHDDLGDIIGKNATYSIDTQYATVKVPSKDGGIDIYSIPTPAAITLSYSLVLVTDSIRECNSFSERLVKLFKTKMNFISPNHHFMAVKFANVSSDGNISEFQSYRMFKH
jgi:hypothetical protein